MKITVTFDALDEFNAFMGKQLNLAEPAPAQAPTGDWYPGGCTMDERELASVELQEKPAEPVKATEEKASPKPEAPAEKAVDHVAARKAMAALNKAAGENIARKLVSAFGYSRLTDVPAEKLPELMDVVARPLDAINAFIAEKGASHAD